MTIISGTWGSCTQSFPQAGRYFILKIQHEAPVPNIRGFCSGSPVVETFSAVWIPGQRAKIPYASWPKKNPKTKHKTEAVFLTNSVKA